MWFTRLSGSIVTAGIIAFALGNTGCNKNDKKVEPQAKGKAEFKNEKVESAHSGWWCQEHGVPEDLCSICMSEANAKKKFKDNGDWCKEHDRAESQCFK